MKLIKVILISSIWLLLINILCVAASNPPLPLQAHVDLTSMRTGHIVFVGSSGNAITNGNLLQAAINNATTGDTLALENVDYQRADGFYFKNKQSITILASNACFLPPSGTRINPQYAGFMPRLIATNPNASTLDFWMQHAPDTFQPCKDIRVVGVDLTSTNNTTQIVKIGGSVWPRSATEQPSNIIFDSVFVHGQPTKNVRRGFVFNGSNLAVLNSWVSDIHEIGADSQAICGWNGLGPFLIHNNYLEAAGENIMFGGADATIQGLIPSDGEICHNELVKPWSWRVGHPTYAGYHWTVKNHLEFKNARRFVVHDNILRNCWEDGQVGYAVDLTPKNQDGSNPWAMVQDIDIYNNTIQHVGTGFDVLGTDRKHPSSILARVRVRDCILEDVKRSYGGYGAAFVFADGSEDFIINNVTMLDHDGLVIACDGAVNIRTTITNNQFSHGDSGIKGSGTEGNECFTTYFPDVIFRGNTLISFPTRLYSNFPDNIFIQ